MGQEMVNVQIGNNRKQYPKGISYLEIAKEYQKDYTDDIVLVFVNGRLQELAKTLKGDCTLSFLTTADSNPETLCQYGRGDCNIPPAWDV